MTRRRPAVERFAAKYVGLPSGCWEWCGFRNGKGYGIFHDGERMVKAHRWSWEHANRRPIPDGLTIDHLCRNRSCVNPEHLEPVTDAENRRRGVAFRRALASERPTPEPVAPKVACVNGHEFTPENTRLRTRASRGGTVERVCRACVRDRQRVLYARRTAA